MMATFYQGKRPVLQGRNMNNYVHDWTGETPVYSYFPLMYSGPELLTGAPDHEYVLGNKTGRNTLFMEYIYTGGHHKGPMDNPGNTAFLEGTRYRPHEFKGLDTAKAL